MYDLAHVVPAGWGPYNLRHLLLILELTFLALDLYHTDLAQPLTTKGEELDHLRIDIS